MYRPMNRSETISSQTIRAYVARGRGLQAAAVRGAFAAGFRKALALAATVLSGYRALRLWYRRRRAIRELQSLDDRLLKDIGLPRSEIGYVVRGLFRDPSDEPAPRQAEVLPLRRGTAPARRKDLAA